MEEKKLDSKRGGIRVKVGVLPGVREIRRPDFSRKAADIEKAETERMDDPSAVSAEDTVDAVQTAGVEESLDAQENGAERLDESAITDEPRWYVAHTYSGYENKVKINIEKTIENRRLEKQIFEVRVPMQDVVEVRNGVKKVVPKKLFPGYVLVNMIMNDETWYVVRNTRGVTGFVGPGSKPVPLSDEEIAMLGNREQEVVINFTEGDTVVVISGAWKDTVGVIKSINPSKRSVTITVEMFGRETPVELSFAEVKKL